MVHIANAIYIQCGGARCKIVQLKSNHKTIQKCILLAQFTVHMFRMAVILFTFSVYFSCSFFVCVFCCILLVTRIRVLLCCCFNIWLPICCSGFFISILFFFSFSKFKVAFILCARTYIREMRIGQRRKQIK